MAELGNAYVTIVPSAKGLGGSIENMLGKEADSAGKKAGAGIAGSIKKALTAAGIGAAVGKVLSEGAKLQQSYIGGLDTIYGKAADKARDYAKAAVQAGISQNDFSEQAVSFGAALRKAYAGDTSKAINTANMAIMDMADNAAKMGTPLQSIQDAYQGFARQNYTMLDNLRLGYGQTKSEMERLLADANKLNAEQGKITDYSIDNLGDIYEAIHVIQDDLGLTGVAAGEAATTFSGSLGAMKAAASNLMGNLMLGEDVKSSMQDLVATTETFLFGNLIPSVGRIFQSLPAAIGTAIQLGLPIIGQQASKLITALTEGINTKVPELAAKLPETIVNVLNGLSEALPVVIAKGAELIEGLGTAIVNNAPLLASAAAEAIQLGLPIIRQHVSNLITALTSSISTKEQELAAKLPEIIANAFNSLSGSLPAVIAKGAELVKGLGTAIISKVSVLASAAAEAINAFTRYLSNNLPEIAFQGGEIIGQLAAGLIKNLPKIAARGVEIIGQLAAGLIKNLPKIAAVSARVISFLASSLGKFTGTMIRSGLSLMAGIASGIGSGIASKVKSAMAKLKETMAKPIEEAKEKIRGILDRIKGFFPISIGRIISGIKLPHFSISGSFSIVPPSVPHFSVSWYKKAEEMPYMFSKATLFGAGERNDEILYGRQALMNDIREATTGGGGNTFNNTFHIYSAADPEETADTIIRQLEIQLRTA